MPIDRISLFDFKNEHYEYINHLYFYTKANEKITFEENSAQRAALIKDIQYALRTLKIVELGRDKAYRPPIESIERLCKTLTAAMAIIRSNEVADDRDLRTALMLHYRPAFAIEPPGAEDDYAERTHQVEALTFVLEQMSAWCDYTLVCVTTKAMGRPTDLPLCSGVELLCRIMERLGVPVGRDPHKRSQIYGFLHTVLGWVRPDISATTIDSLLRLRKNAGGSLIDFG